MKLIVIFEWATNARLRFSLLIILHIIFYAITCFYAAPIRPLVIFSAVWTLGYIFAIRRFLTNPVDDFASKHISYAQPNMYWVDFAKRLVKNNIRFRVISLCHLFIALIPILLKNSLNESIIIAIFISNAILPITYLYILKKLYLLWTQK